MKKMYFKHAALALGIVAIAGTAAAEGTWRSVTSEYLKNPSMYVPYWNGGFADLQFGVGETWNAPMGISQVIDAPAGHYKLTVPAFYRYGDGDFAFANTESNRKAFIFLGTAKEPVMSIYNHGYDVASAPNNMEQAANAFKEGKYVNKVEFDHPGGDLKLGLSNPGVYSNQWCIFGAFTLEGPNGNVKIPNGDFSEPIVDFKNCGWDNFNVKGGEKQPDSWASRKDDFSPNDWGAAAIGGFRKAGGSPYNHGQQIELPAGKYRFGAQSFIRYGCGNQSGWWVPFKGGWDDVAGCSKEEGESAYDKHLAGCNVADVDRAYLYVTNGVQMNEEETAFMKPIDKDEAHYGAVECEKGLKMAEEKFFYNQTPIKCLFDEEAIGGTWPDNAPKPGAREEGTPHYANSGFEHYAISYLVANPDSYRNYVEFELTETTKVWVGMKKDTNVPDGYWHSYREFTLEKFDNGSGVADLVVEDENAPVEYYNLQGIRVANPENGLYIVKQGNKVTKRIIK